MTKKKELDGLRKKLRNSAEKHGWGAVPKGLHVRRLFARVFGIPLWVFLMVTILAGTVVGSYVLVSNTLIGRTTPEPLILLESNSTLTMNANDWVRLVGTLPTPTMDIPMYFLQNMTLLGTTLTNATGSAVYDVQIPTWNTECYWNATAEMP